MGGVREALRGNCVGEALASMRTVPQTRYIGLCKKYKFHTALPFNCATSGTRVPLHGEGGERGREGGAPVLTEDQVAAYVEDGCCVARRARAGVHSRWPQALQRDFLRRPGVHRLVHRLEHLHNSLAHLRRRTFEIRLADAAVDEG